MDFYTLQAGCPQGICQYLDFCSPITLLNGEVHDDKIANELFELGNDFGNFG